MFKVTTLDINNPPRTKDGLVDYAKDFFGRETNLTVTGQLEGEAYAHAFRNIYTFGPTFRAENSNTPTHASEFWMIEPEIAFADLNVNMDVIESMVKYVTNYVLEHAKEEMTFFNKFVEKGLLDKLDNLLNSTFKRITHEERSEEHTSELQSRPHLVCRLLLEKKKKKKMNKKKIKKKKYKIKKNILDKYKKTMLHKYKKQKQYITQ